MNVWRWFVRAFVARIGWVLAGLLLIGLGLTKAHAALTCPAGTSDRYTYSGGAGANWSNQFACVSAISAKTPGAARAAADGCLGGKPDQLHSGSNITKCTVSGSCPELLNVQASGTATQIGMYYASVPYGSAATPVFNITMSQSCVADSCPTAGTAYEYGNTIKGGHYDSNLKVDVNLPNGQVCQLVGSGICLDFPAASVEAGSTCTKWQYTGSSGNPGTAGSPVSTAVSSQMFGGEQGACTADGKTCVPLDPNHNCGTFNGDYVCLGAATPVPGGCVTAASGNQVCVTDSTHPLVTPPAPATAPGSGVVQTPAMTMADGRTTGNSGQGIAAWLPGGLTTQGQPGATTGGTPASTDTPPAVQCGGTGMPACKVDIGETNPGALTLPTMATARTFSDSNAALGAAVSASPLISAVSSVSIPTTGTCPTFNVDVPFFSTSFTFSSHCDIFESIRGTLSIMFLAIFSLVALRIALSA